MEIQLIPLDAERQAALDRDADYRAALAAGDWAQLAHAMQRLLGGLETSPTAAATSDRPAHWGGFIARTIDTGTVMGSCAFKGAPDASGAVEIAYFTYPGGEGRGVGTAMARALVAMASAYPIVRLVVAHTLPMPSASTRILETVGLRHVGDVIDPEDGPVWRWERVMPETA